MKNNNLNINENSLFTYRRLRRAIGFLGISLPIMLLLLSQIDFFNTKVQPSISHYYYTNFREIFTGTLCAVGLFLVRYKGTPNNNIWKNDNFLTNMAGIMALGVALFPTSPEKGVEKIFSLIPFDNALLNWLHYGFAAMLFLIFSILAINVFTIGQKNETMAPKSIFDENNIYRFCGYSIIVFIILIPISVKFNLFKNSTLLLEALALFLFGSAWLIKGRVLGDKGKIGRKVYRENNTEKKEVVNLDIAQHATSDLL